MTNEPLQSPLRPTVDAARLAEFIANANSRVSAIRGRRMEATGILFTCETPSIFSDNTCRYGHDNSVMHVRVRKLTDLVAVLYTCLYYWKFI